MLVHLSVKDIALIDRVELDLQPGMTVLTGETGAGKSILVEALTLLLGGRASADVVRVGSDEGAVAGQFALHGAIAETVQEILRGAGLPALDDGALLLKRVVSRQGRHKQFVNGEMCTAAQLRLVAEPLVDFTGQHAQQLLVRSGAQLALLDGYGAHEELARQVAAAVAQAQAVAQEAADLRTREGEKERRLDLLRFYLDEIEQISPREGEDVALAAEQRKLQNAARLGDAVAEATSLLTDGEADALSALQRALSALQRAARDDEELAPSCATLAEAVALVDDVARGLQRHEVQNDPARLQVVDDRLDALQRLCKKHGGTVASVLEAQATMAAEQELLTRSTERLLELSAALQQATAAATSLCDTLTAKRKAAAKKLQTHVEAELPSLAMAGGRLEVRVEPLVAPSGSLLVRPDGRALSAHGSDRVELWFSANAGEAPEPLSKVASGGELSRVLLALKRVLLSGDPVPVTIFDEVDVGVGGAVGDAIGEKIEAIAQGRQVLCITHLPQIASRAMHHLLVEKSVENGRTLSRVRVLAEAERVDEISRMLGGKEITLATRRHAEDMLGRALRLSTSTPTPAPQSLPPSLPPPATASEAKARRPRKGA